VKEKFGTRAKLIDAIAELDKRAKDEGYKVRLGNFPVPRLFDMWQASSKRAGNVEKAAKPKVKRQAKPVKPAVKKPVKKAAATKKSGGKKR
jgi:hypothetical protein